MTSCEGRREHHFINTFIKKVLFLLQVLKRLYPACFRDDLDDLLQSWDIK